MEPTESEYGAFCEHVQRVTRRIAAHCLGGRMEEAGKLALELCTDATTRQEQRNMEQEADTGAFDLGALRETFKTQGDGG